MSGSREDVRFIAEFTLCQVRDEKLRVVGPVHLHRSTPRRAWANRYRAGWPICRTEAGDKPMNLMQLDPPRPFNPARDLADICPDCRAVYERLARERLGAPVAGRLVF